MTSPETSGAKPRHGPLLLAELRGARERHQQRNAARRQEWVTSNPLFYDAIVERLRFIIPEGKSVLAVRCETGHLLAALKPSRGVGVDISEAMVAEARSRHPELHFVRQHPEELKLDEKFDYVLFDHVFDTVDILTALRAIRRHCHRDTRLVVLNYNSFWQPALEAASELGLRASFVEPNWVTEADLRGFMGLAGLRPIRTHRTLLVPKYVPGLAEAANHWLAHLPGMRRLCMMHMMVARLAPVAVKEEDVTVSVIIPCRNEVGNIEDAVERIPQMGKHTEIIFCDDKSTDGTPDEVRRMQKLHPGKDIRLVAGPGICKAENVWTGFRAAKGDVLMILDADLTVMPEELPMFLRALTTGRGDFINGSRLVYPMQKEAMKLANRVGNKAFGQTFSFLLDQPIKDTLCGTKVFWRRDWPLIESTLGTWGIKDLWGDYELLFGASRHHLKIVEVPVHYQERIFGVTKMTRVLQNGLRMAGICWNAWRRLY